MAFGAVELLNSPTYSAMRFKGTYTDAQSLLADIQAVVPTRALVRWLIIGLLEGEEPDSEYRIELTRADGELLNIFRGMWIVAYSTGLIEVYEDGPYRAKFTLPQGEV